MTHKLFMVAITAAFLLPAQTTYAASDDECAIWLCLPTGFPSGCSGAKVRLKNVLKTSKRPFLALDLVYSLENFHSVLQRTIQT